MPHHKRDWKQDNKQLINRGNLNFWITKKALKFWKAKKKKNGSRPFYDSDEAIRAMLIIKFLAISQVPYTSQVCRRMRSVELPENLIEKRGVTDLVFDTTGLAQHIASLGTISGFLRKKKYPAINNKPTTITPTAILKKTSFIILSKFIYSIFLCKNFLAFFPEYSDTHCPLPITLYL